MSVDIDGKMMIGVDAYDVYYDEDEYEDVSEFIGNSGLSYMSPYYDSDPSDWFVGIEVRDMEISWLFSEEGQNMVRDIVHKVEETTGCTPRLHGGAHVW